MESNFFSALDLDSKNGEMFLSNLAKSLPANEEALLACLEIFPNVWFANIPEQRKKLIEELSVKTKVPIITLDSFFKTLIFFVRSLINNEGLTGDTPEQWANDLLELKKINKEDKDKFIAIFGSLLSDHFPSLKKRYYENQAGVGVFPSIMNVEATVELRAVQDSHYGYMDEINQYTPTITGVVAIASIKIDVNSEQNSEFCFQTTEEDLDILIRQLKATQADLVALKNMYGKRSL